MSFITPVYDRTQSNVNNVLRGINDDKGALLHTVLNRIENNISYLASLLTSLGYYISLECKLDWTREDIPNRNDINRIKNNLILLKKAYYTYNSTPSVDLNKISVNYVDVNNMEKIEKDIEDLIYYMNDFISYCGMVNTNTPLIWQQRFIRVRNWINIPYNTFDELLDSLKISNFSILSDKPVEIISSNTGVWSTIQLLNNKNNEIDNITGGIYE